MAKVMLSNCFVFIFYHFRIFSVGLVRPRLRLDVKSHAQRKKWLGISHVVSLFDHHALKGVEGHNNRL